MLGGGRRVSRFIVSDDDVVVRMGWWFRTVIPRSSIVAATPDHDPVWGWGAHGWGGRWLVNGSSRGLIRLTIDPPAPAKVCFVGVRLRLLRISLVDPDGALAALG